MTSINGGASFVYDGDGNRVKKTEGGETIVYINQYYEKNTTTGVVTTYYYLGGKLIAKRTASTTEYIHQDSLSSTSLTTDTSGVQVGTTMKYFPFGDRRNSQGEISTDRLFTGQRLDDTGLYYYGARYYDAGIGRFISPDTMVQYFANPQSWNRYSYTLNNPLKFIDSTGSYVEFTGGFSYRSPGNRKTLEEAWKMLEWAATDIPKLAEVMKKVEESDSLVKIGWTPIGSRQGSVVLGDDRLGKQSVYIDADLLNYDVRIIAHTLAHELYHAAEGRQVDSIQEEMEAYNLEYDVAKKLCLPLKDSKLKELGELDPLNSADLFKGESILKSRGAVYPWIPLEPMAISDPFIEMMIFGGYWWWYETFNERAQW